MAAEAVGSAYVLIRAVTTKLAKDIQDGLDKGAKDVDVDGAGKDIGDRMGEAGGESFGDSFDETGGKRLEKSADSPDMKKGQDKFTDKIFGRFRETFRRESRGVGDELGSNVSASFERGTRSVDIDRAAGTLGSDLGDEVGDDFDVSFQRNLQHTFSRNSRNNTDRLSTGASGVGMRLGQNVAEGMTTSIASGLAGAGSSIFSALEQIKVPGGTFALVAQVALPALAGALQTVGALAGSTVAILGFLGTAALGAGVAFAGLAAAAAPAFFLIKGAFGAETPALEHFNDKLDDFKKDWEEVAKATQTWLLPALEGAVDNLTLLIPLFTKYGETIGGVVGDIAFGVSEVLTEPKNMARIDSILTKGSSIIRTLGDAAVSFVTPLLTILNAAMPFAQRLADAILRGSDAFADWIDKADKSGALTAMFDKWYNRFRLIGSILGNLGGVLADVFGLGADSADGMFETLDKITEKWKEWTNSDAGQKKLTAFFENARRISGEVFGLLGDIVKIFAGPLFETDSGATDGIVGFFKSIREEWLPTLKEWFTVAKDALSGPVGAFFGAISDFVKALSANPEVVAGIFAVLATNFFVFTAAIKAVTAALQTDLGKKIVLMVLGLLAFLKVVGTISRVLKPFALLLKGVFGVFSKLGFLFNPVVLAFAAIVGGIALLYFHFKPFRDFVDRNIIDPLQRLWESIQVVGGLGELFKTLPALLRILWDSLPTVDFKALFSDPLGTLASLAHDVADALRNTFEGIPLFSQIANGLAAAFDFMATGMEKLKKLFKNPFKGALKFIEIFHNLGNVLGELVGKGIDALIRNLPHLGTILGKVFAIIVKGILAGLGALITLFIAHWALIIPTIVTIFQKLPALLLAALKGLGNFVVSFLRELGVLEAVQKYFPIVVGYLIGFFQALPGMIVDGFAKFGPIVGEAVLGFIILIGKLLLQGILALPGALGALGGFLLSKGAELLGGLWEGVKNFWEGSVKPWFGHLPGYILDAIVFIASGVGKLGAKGAELLGAFWEGVKNFWNDSVKPWFGHLPGYILDAIAFIGSGLGKIGAKGKELLGAFWEGIKNFWTDSVKPWFGHLPGMVLDAISFIGSGVGQLGAKGAQLLGAFWQGIKNFWNDSVKPWFGHIPGMAIDAIQFIASGVGRLGSVGKGILGAILSGAQDFFTTDVVQWFKDLPGNIISGLGTIASWAGDMLHLGSELMRQLLLGLVQWGQEHAPEWIQDAFHFDQLEEKLAPGIRQIRESFNKINDAVVDGIAASSPEMDRVYGQIFEDIFQHSGDAAAVTFAEAWSAAMSSGGGLDPTEIEALMALATELLSQGGEEGAAGFTSGLSKGFSKANPAEAGKAVVEQLRKGVNSSLTENPFDIPLPNLEDNVGVQGWASDSATTLRKQLGGQIQKVKRSEFKAPAEAMLNNLGSGLKKGQNLLKPFSVGLILQIIGWIQTTVKLMQTMGVSMMLALLQGLKVGFLLVSVFMRTVPAAMVKAMGNLANVFTPAGLALMLGLTNAVRAGLIVLIALLSGIRSKITGAVGNLSGLLTAQGSAMMNGLVNGVRVGLISLGVALSGIRNSILNAVGRMDKLLYPVGRDLIQGLINGIQSMLPALRQAAQGARNVASSATGGKTGAQLAMGGIINGPMVATIGEAGREVVIPLTRPLRALSLLHASGLDDLVRGGSPTGGDVTLLNIEHADIHDKVDVDMVAARLNSAYKAMISPSGTRGVA